MWWQTVHSANTDIHRWLAKIHRLHLRVQVRHVQDRHLSLSVETQQVVLRQALLFPPLPAMAAAQRPLPDLAWVHQELRRANVTLGLLWEEYRAGTPDGFGYSWFCELYHDWVGRLKPTLRQVHIAGEKLFVDFAGQTMEVVDGFTGEVRGAEIFVAVLGASNYTYAAAC